MDYKPKDKVITTSEWNNGLGLTVPVGSVVEVVQKLREPFYDCLFNGRILIFEKEWLGDKIKTNGDRIRSMTDEELAEILVFNNCSVWCTNISDAYYKHRDCAIENTIKFLQKESED